MDLSLRLLADASNAQGAFKDFGSAVTATGKIVADFAKESIKAYAEAEKVQRQLKLAAGEYTAALSEQAEAMKQKYAVDDDAIRHMEVLLLRYGAAPGVIQKTIEATLDYAAATGGDATQALQQLIRGVEAGNGSLGRMGVHFKTTGKFSGDLANAVDELGKKFGGAGVEDANSLSGRMRAAELATDDFKKAAGALFVSIEAKIGVIEALNHALEGLKTLVNDPGMIGILAMHALGIGDDATSARKALGIGLQKGLDMGLPASGPALPTTSAGDHAVGKKDKKEKDDWGWGPFGDPEKSFDGWQAEYEEMHKKQQDELEKDRAEAARKDREFLKKEEEDQQKHDDEMLEMHRKASDMELDEVEKHQAELKKKFDQQKEMWGRAGDAMGAALVNAVGSQLERLAEGGDMDVGDTLGDVAAAILGVAGVAIGTYFGAPAVGGAIGGLAGGLVKAGIHNATHQTHHQGGWIQRFHSGGWPLGGDEVPAVLQTGERVLSRREVSNMGGPAGVESAARGRGGMVVNIHTLDSQSFQDSFGRDAGRGFFNAVRIGRGDLVPLFGR